MAILTEDSTVWLCVYSAWKLCMSAPFVCHPTWHFCRRQGWLESRLCQAFGTTDEEAEVGQSCCSPPASQWWDANTFCFRCSAAINSCCLLLMRYTLLSADQTNHAQLHIKSDAFQVTIRYNLQWFGLAICQVSHWAWAWKGVCLLRMHIAELWQHIQGTCVLHVIWYLHVLDLSGFLLAAWSQVLVLLIASMWA